MDRSYELLIMDLIRYASGTRAYQLTIQQLLYNLDNPKMTSEELWRRQYETEVFTPGLCFRCKQYYKEYR